MVATLYAVRCISESIHCLQATCSMCFAAKFQITSVGLLVMQPRHCPASYLHWPQQLNSKSNDVRNFHRPFSSQCTPQNMSEAKERQELKIWGEKKTKQFRTVVRLHFLILPPVELFAMHMEPKSTNWSGNERLEQNQLQTSLELLPLTLTE